MPPFNSIPTAGPTYRYIADAWLRQDNAAEGLKWAEVAVEKGRASTAPEESRNTDLGENLATLAWAIAATSADRQKVEQMVNEAVALVESRRVPASCAQVHVTSAWAYSALGDLPKRGRHLEAAARVDPNGLWGRAARSLVAAQ